MYGLLWKHGDGLSGESYDLSCSLLTTSSYIKYGDLCVLDFKFKQVLRSPLYKNKSKINNNFYTIVIYTVFNILCAVFAGM